MPKDKIILIVDDDPFVRKAIKRLVQSAGYTSRTFASAREFFDSGDMAKDGILLLDVRMPGMDGLEMQEQLLSSGIGIPVIFITAHDDPQIRTTVMDAGAVAFITKPFDDQTLLDAINVAGQKRSYK